MAWKNGKKWVYSITYDEGCELLLKHALPIHRKYGIPGHVALVASQVGVKRNVPGSSYDGMMILSRDRLKMLSREGWGISCHGMNHVYISEKNVEEELFLSRLTLEKATGFPVKMFCLPGDNSHFKIVHDRGKEAGYAANLTIYDRINRIDCDLMALGRVPLHTEYPPPFYSEFDPYKRIHQAIDEGGWIIDYCHCPMPGKPIHQAKDCTTEQLEERFATVRRVGGNDVWPAEPNEVVGYLLDKSKEKT